MKKSTKSFICTRFGKMNSEVLQEKDSLGDVEILHKKWSFLLRVSSVNVTILQETLDLVTFTEEILKWKLHFLFDDSEQ